MQSEEGGEERRDWRTHPFCASFYGAGILLVQHLSGDANVLGNSRHNNQERIKIQIEDFIHAQLYDKIYSGMAVINDIQIFKKCFTLKWIKPIMLNEKLTYLDEKMIQMMRSFIRNIDEEISPNNKLREFEKLDLIINNMMTLYGYSKDVYLSILVFAFIKGQPYQLNSSYKYIEMFNSTT